MKSVTAEARYVLQFINQTNCSVFLTGKAGTGKTTLLKEIIQTTHKNTVVVAPTGIAALNAGGVTIHSMFQLPFGGFLPDNSSPQFTDSSTFESRLTLRRHFKMSGLKKAVIRNMELLIIDEAQNLTPKQMKTLITRAGPGTKVICLGNISQIDTPYLTEGSSGLTYVVDRFKGWPYSGHVTLQRGERSRLAERAGEIL